MVPELEKLLLHCPTIREVAVSQKGAHLHADIYGRVEDQPAIRSYVTELNRTLPLYKRITLVEFRTEPFPRTSTGKIKRHEGDQ